MDEPLNVPEGTGIYICYIWHFYTQILTKKNKRYKNHHIKCLGSKYEDAKYDLEAILKKKRAILEKINLVEVKEISFAFYQMKGHPFVPWEKHRELPLPEIPTDYKMN